MWRARASQDQDQLQSARPAPSSATVIARSYPRFQNSCLTLQASVDFRHKYFKNFSEPRNINMSDEEDIAALVVDNGSGMCKGAYIEPTYLAA
jgi:hypothetical protein